MKIAYSTAFTPPAPVISAQVSTPDDEVHSPVLPTLIDTGSDSTAIPEFVVEQLQLIPAGEMLVQAYDGTPTERALYDVVLRVANIRFDGASVIVCAGDHVILGRDILNYLHLLLDGPALTLEILEEQSPISNH